MGLLSTPIGQGIKAGSGLLDEILELYKTEPLTARKMAKRSGILDEIDSQIPRPKGDVSNAAALRAEANAQRVGDADYRGQHSAPMSGDNAPLHDLSQVYPDDIYSSKGLQYYGTGDNAIDSESMDIINSLKGKPDQTVTMYRSVPSDAGDVDINAGDWVSLSESYVKQHGESALNGDYKIISKEVPANQLFTNGDSINEFGFDPSSKGLLMDTPSRMARAKEQGFDTDKKVYHGTADDFDAFDPDRAIGTQFWSTTNKAEIESGDVGAQGSGVIKEMYHRIKNPAGWDEYDKFGVDELISKGYDGLKLPDGKGDYTYVAFDPSQYRSVDAAFDPAKISSSNLLASNPVATAAGLGGVLAMTGSEDADAGVVGSGKKGLLNLFHGSPYNFDAFDINKVGTGHGQMRGHGLYLSDDLPTARQFKVGNDANLVGVVIDGVPANSLNLSVEDKNYIKMIDRYGSVDNAISKRKEIINDAVKNKRPEAVQVHQETLDGLSAFKGMNIERIASEYEGRSMAGHFGHGYKVESQIEPNNLLDWDLPLSKQTGEVQEALKPEIDALQKFADRRKKPVSEITGEEIYYNIIPEAKNIKEASDKLKSLGISGNKYANDYPLKGTDGDSSNYVLFSDKGLNITDKFSNPVATTGAGLLAMDNVGQESQGLMDAIAGRDAMLTSQQVEYLNNQRELQQLLGTQDTNKFNYADIVPMKRNKETGERSFAMTGLLRDIIEAGHNVVQSQRTGIQNQQSLWDIIL